MSRADIPADVFYRPLQYYTTPAREIKWEAVFFLNKMRKKKAVPPLFLSLAALKHGGQGSIAIVM